MKRLFQIVAVAVVALLGVQPALAGLPCAAGVSAGDGCAPGCGMAMSQGQMMAAPMPSSEMSADCGMAPQIVSDGCAQNCCSDRVSQGLAQPATGEKSSAGRTVDFVPAVQTATVASPVVAVRQRADYDSAAPPRYILFQVFRI